MLHVILHGLLFISLVFSAASLYNISMRKKYKLIHCVFDISIARKYMRVVDEKQEINLLWPYPPATHGFIIDSRFPQELYLCLLSVAVRCCLHTMTEILIQKVFHRLVAETKELAMRQSDWRITNHCAMLLTGCRWCSKH